jgi:hypothetical protein
MEQCTHPFSRRSNALIARCFKIENNKLIPILTEKPLLNENVIKLISFCKFGFKIKQCASRKAALKCSVLCHTRGKSDTPCSNTPTSF